MATDAQLAANRRNARKSTGPRTPEGKAVSSQNATRHGLFASSVLLANESEMRLQELLDAHLTRFQPADMVERGLVEAMVAAQWRQWRLWGYEAALCDLAADQMESEVNQQWANLDPTARGALAWQQAATAPGASTLARQEGRLHRQYLQAQARLLSLQQQRHKENNQNEANPAEAAA